MLHRDISRERLASMLGISVQAVGQVVTGKTKSFSALNHSLTCRLLQCDDVWLASGKGPSPKDSDALRTTTGATGRRTPQLSAADHVIGLGMYLRSLTGYRRTSVSAVLHQMIDAPETADAAAAEVARIPPG